jgi:hypothetical protein
MESNKAGIIKTLLAEGFSEKSIVMVMQVQQPYVNKIKNGKLHRDTNAASLEAMTPQECARYEATKKITAASDLPTASVDEQDRMYIHLLKFFNVPKDKIRQLYNHFSVSKIDKILRRKDVNLGNFDSMLLGIARETYLDLIIDYID